MSISDPVDFSTQGANLNNFITTADDSVFKYLINCESIVMDGCSSVTSNVTVNGQTVN
jgi:hypothetical protein